jgi:hypothetical protein
MLILEELGREDERHVSRGGKGSYPVEGGIFVPNNVTHNYITEIKSSLINVPHFAP